MPEIKFKLSYTQSMNSITNLHSHQKTRILFFLGGGRLFFPDLQIRKLKLKEVKLLVSGIARLGTSSLCLSEDGGGNELI